ncbi:hypothetical protein [Parapedobacter indicus]|uniref:Apea-like HEPN domain-containing protein n=1 Tax=Parapedobacter indicus TaxID=1477437 RepID=A0A1I3CJT4_9SPHI|nr:hypothetical protein [Parapedobacter indicus]PPL04272.1 hypothetical protein CLV26_10173 [Parapedobacter indicus]SFH74586.1 hypothetical protein SAMN05444682_10160 [Parapedobacter indicus]
MKTITRWVVPCYFTDAERSTDVFEMDLTGHLRSMLTNEVWNRKFAYNFGQALQRTDSATIEAATVKVFPRFISGMVNKSRLQNIVQEECGRIYSAFNIESYKTWPHRLGLTIFEIRYNINTPTIPSRKDLTGDIIPHFKQAFIEEYQRLLALLQELGSFFLAGLHLTFPTSSFMELVRNDIVDGFCQIKSLKRSFFEKKPTDAFMHEILIERSKQANLEINLKGLANVWHYDLWPLNRYLKAVESDRVSMDNLLDLIFALEGMFKDNVSSEFVKMVCILNMCKDRKQARSMKSLMDVAYFIRNNIAHGSISYNPYDRIKLENNEVMVQDIYWEMKGLVASMLIKGISKLLQNPNMRNLRFTMDDFIHLLFPKR